MARLAREDSFIGRHRLIDAALPVQLDGALHHFAQFGIRAARRRGTGLRFAASALSTVHSIFGLDRWLLAFAPDCNLALVGREVFPLSHDEASEHSETVHFPGPLCDGGRR